MSDINKIDLRLIDTTILMVFLGIMQHRQATAVAHEMGLTQPAISHALKRLRNLYGDPLFLRRAHGLEPTALARELEPKVRRIVRLLSETLAQENDFDPQKASLDLKLGTFDYEALTIMPDLLGDLYSSAPHIGVHALPLTNRIALQALIEGRLDMAIGYFEFVAKDAENFVVDALYYEQYVAVARAEHPLFTDRLTLAEYAAAEHLTVSPSGPAKTMVDHALQLKGLSRNSPVTVSTLFAALSIIENSDYVVTLPSRVARKNVSRFNLTYLELPFDSGTYAINVVRHRRDADSALHLWLVERLSALVANETKTAD